MRIYPIRTTRNKWNIKIFCYHTCSESCETIIINRGDYVEVRLNPSYVNNACRLTNTIEKSAVQLHTFDRATPMCDNGPLVAPDEVVIPDKSFTVNIDFPLSYTLNIEIHTSQIFTKKDLIYAIKTLYKFIYDEEERTATPQLYQLNKICSNCNLQSLMNHTEEVKVDDDCCICYNGLQEDSVKLRCSHIFHKSCISQWIKTSATCPICRTNIFVCSNCNGTGVIFYYFTGVVIPLDQRGDRINRNLSNGIFGIHSYDFESLILCDMTYDRQKKSLSFKIAV
jgi:hypothetical protein